MPDLITEARELCEKASPAPWKYVKCGNHVGLNTTTWGCCGTFIGEDDAVFFARSRTLVPELADALEKANAEIERLKTGFDYAGEPNEDGYEDRLGKYWHQINAISENCIKNYKAENERLKAAQSEAIATLQKIEWVGSGAKGLIGDAIGILCGVEPESEEE